MNQSPRFSFLPLLLVLFSMLFLASCREELITNSLQSLETFEDNLESNSFFGTFTVISITPADGTRNIAVNSDFTVVFSEAVNLSSVSSSTFKVKESVTTGNVYISGTYSQGANASTVSFTPTRSLNYDSSYDVELVTGIAGIRSQEGDVLSGSPTWNLTTRLRAVDTDRDGLSDTEETDVYSTDPNNSDSDGDGLNDLAEIMAGLDPNDASDAHRSNNLTNDPVYYFQWHNKNEAQTSGASNPGTAGEDINVEPAWAKVAGSTEVVVSVVDTGIEATHPDLSPNLNLDLSYRYSDGSNDPTPLGIEQNPPHGTACAGLIGARGWNQEGLRGVAPFVQLVGLNAFSAPTNANFLDALSRLNVDISSNSWGPNVADLAIYPTDIEGIEQGIIFGRQGKGIVYVFAAGNEDFNANTGSNVHNSRFVIAVSAVNAKGLKADYSNYGTNILVSAPGGEDGVTHPAMVTTDIRGSSYGFDTSSNHFWVSGNENYDYTNKMNGTSSAAPVVSGVAAMVLQINPDLTYRDVKYILATSARKPIPSAGDSQWVTGVTKEYNWNYGFGVVDAAAAVTMAETFSGLGPEKSSQKYDATVDSPITDSNATGVSSSITVSESITIEHVDIWVTATHSKIEQLEIVLQAPSGRTSKLAENTTVSFGGMSYSNWRFSTVRHLDENSTGTWTLTIKDLTPGTTGTFNSWSLRVYGH